MIHKVIIIGTGPAGLTAALYAGRANMEPVIFEGPQPGGQLTITTDVENYPGFPDGIMGPELMDLFRKQAQRFGAKTINLMVDKVDFSLRPFKVWTGDTEYQGETIIISTGAQARWLNIDTEEKFKGYGISTCATCDGFFFKDKEVAVIGGGNSAVEEALYLTNFVTKVTLIHRRDSLRAEKILQDRLFKNSKIKILWNKKVKEFFGSNNPISLKKIILEDTINQKHSEISVSGAFIAIGHDPATSLFKNKLKMDKENYIITKTDSTETNIEGIFAAGDVKDKIYRQAVTAAGMGCMAALDAEKFLSENES